MKLTATLPGLVDETRVESFFTAVDSGQNVFLTGRAGTGKTTQLRRLLKECDRAVAVTAPTGVAALNAGGTTIHRWAGIMIGPQNGQTNQQCWEDLRESSRKYKSLVYAWKRVEAAEVLVIDEISMLPGRAFDFLNFQFQQIRHDPRPFGGVQLVCIGDFLQLPPVQTNVFKPYDWAFNSPAWREADFTPVVLHKVWRQDELNFISALSDFRVGDITPGCVNTLSDRVKRNVEERVPRLFTHNVNVDKWNGMMLESIPGDLVEFDAIKAGQSSKVDFLVKNMLPPETLQLKVGAQVMTTINDRENRFVNGTIGKVWKIDGDQITVQTDYSQFDVQRFRHVYDPKNPDTASVSQFPLRLAWAMTIHKAQGITLPEAYIDIRAAREPGQAYVALSRVKTLAGLNLRAWPNGLFVSKEAVNFYKNLK